MYILSLLFYFADSCGPAAGDHPSVVGGPTTLCLDSVPKPPADASQIQKLIADALIILGMVAVLMVVIGGIRYIASRGKPEETAKAKDTIIYAIVGLLVAITAWGIVHFVTARIA